MILVAPNQVSLVQPATPFFFDKHNGQCMIGYIKLHRQILDSPSFKNVHEQMAFAWLLLRAQWQDVDIRYKGIRLSLKRGQLALSYRDFAKEWGWSEARCRRYIAKLSEMKPKSNRHGSDAVVSATSDAGVCIITILNYNKFQDSDKKDDAPNDAPLNGKATHQRRTSDAQNKEDNKIRNKDIKDISKDISKNPVEKIKGKTIAKRKSIKQFIRENLKGSDDLPDDFRAYAQKWGHPEPDVEWEMFINTWLGSGDVKADWLATWRNRVTASKKAGWYTSQRSQNKYQQSDRHLASRAAHGVGLRKAISMDDM